MKVTSVTQVRPRPIKIPETSQPVDLPKLNIAPSLEEPGKYRKMIINKSDLNETRFTARKISVMAAVRKYIF